MTTDERRASLSAFTDFVKTNLTGDEKGEAQTFLSNFFQALGHKSVQEAVATFEFRIAKKPGSSQLELFTGDDAKALTETKGGKKFADLLWPKRVLIEMKSCGTNLRSTPTRPLTIRRYKQPAQNSFP